MHTFKGLSAFLLTLALAACSKPPQGGGPSGGGPPGGGERVVPVSVANVQQRDVPIFIDALGTVAAYQTVTVRSQVDGRLEKVFFREGQPVHRGEELALIDPQPFINQLHQAEAALARDKAMLATNQRNLERYTQLAQQKLIASQQADDQRGLVEQGEGTVRADEAAVESAKVSLGYAHIVSPLDGVTGIRSVDPGNLVHASDATGIVVVTQLDPIAVLIALPQDSLSRVAEQQNRSPLEVQVFGRDDATVLGRGHLEVIDNTINTTTATLRLKAVMPNPQHALWPNAFVKTRLLLTTRNGVLVVPAQALQRGPNGTFVYVVGSDQTVQPRPVTVDLEQEDLAIIAKGVQQGEVVVTEGQNQLRPGSKVSTRQPGGQTDGGTPADGGSPAYGGHRGRGTGGGGGDGGPRTP